MCQEALLHEIVVDRLSSPDFDQSRVIPAFLKEVLQVWDPATTTPDLPDKLAFAMLKRAADDKAVWQNKHASWEEQGNNVAYLWFALNDMAANKACHESAAQVLNVIFAAFDNDDICKCCLLEQHIQYTFNNSAATDPDKPAAMDLRALFNALEGHLPAQLTFAACLIRLCLVEIGHQLQVGKSHELADTAAPLAARALCSNNGAFLRDMYLAIRAAVETPLPWQTEHCVALARVLEMCSRLCAVPDLALPKTASAISQRLGIVLLLHQKLQQLHKLTSSHRLQQKFLVASLGVLCPDWEPADQCFPEGLSNNLIDLLVKFTGPSASAQPDIDSAASPNEDFFFPTVGLSPLRPLELQTKTLDVIMKTLQQQADFVYLGKHAFPVCVPPFVEYAQRCMDRYVQTGKVTPQMPNLQPYLIMLGCHQMTVGKKQSRTPPAGAAQAVLQLLFLLVHRLEMAHVLDVAPKVTQFEKDSASWCVEQVNKTKACLMLLLAVMKNMREDKPWMHAWGALWPWRWTKDKRAPDRLTHWLRSLLVDGILTKDQVLRIMEYLVVKLDPAVAEASALVAAAQLLAEEEQAASKAATKKAKKLRQKQAKQPQTLVSATKTSSADMMNPESNSALPVHGGTDSDPVPAESAKELSVQSSMSRLQIHSATTESCCSQSQQFLQTELDGMVQPDRLQSSAVPVGGQDTGLAGGAAQSRCMMHMQSEPDEASLERPSVLSASPQAAAAIPASAKPSQGPSPDACFLQKLLCCPLTQVLMVDPVIAADGRSYERLAMEDWLQHHDTSPVTGSKLLHKRLVPNVSARAAIANHLV